MTCTNPFRLKQSEGGVLELPCGHCTACKIARSREWASRLIHELQYHKKASFVTLTYDEEHLPYDKGLHKDELQRYFKRIRKNLPPRSVKYFSSGEYGDIGGRPHYHAIIFGIGLSVDDQELLRNNWNLGFVNIGNVTFDSCRYVTDYVLKKYDGKKRAETYGEKQQPFCLMSKGIGRQFVIDNKEYLEQNGGFTLRGAPVGLPRYYKDVQQKIEQEDGSVTRVNILDLDFQEIRARAIENQKKVIDEFKKRCLIDDDDFVFSLLKAKKQSRNQAEINLNTKNNLYKKKL